MKGGGAESREATHAARADEGEEESEGGGGEVAGGSVKTTDAAGPALVRRRVRVWWAGDGAWFTGIVRTFSSRRGHCIEYDDGEVKYHALDDGDESWELLVDVPVPGADGKATHGVGSAFGGGAASCGQAVVRGGIAVGGGVARHDEPAAADASSSDEVKDRCRLQGCRLPNLHAGLCQIASVPSKRPRAALPMRYGVPLLQELEVQERLKRQKLKAKALCRNGLAAPNSLQEERAMLARAVALSTALALPMRNRLQFCVLAFCA